MRPQKKTPPSLARSNRRAVEGATKVIDIKALEPLACRHRESEPFKLDNGLP